MPYVNISLSDVAYAALSKQAKRNGIAPTTQARMTVLGSLPVVARAATPKAAPSAPVIRPKLPGRPGLTPTPAATSKRTKGDMRRELAEAVRNTGGVKA